MERVQPTALPVEAVSADLLQRLLEHVPHVIFLVNGDGTIRFASAAANSMIGFTSDTLVGEQCFAFMEPQQIPAAMTAARLATHNPGVPQKFEILSTQPSVKANWLECTITSHLHDPRIGALVVNVYDITDRKLAQQAALDAANHDGLTGLPNRALILPRLDALLAQAGDATQLAGISFIDLDGFKQVNDQYGHRVGDELLIAVADRLKVLTNGSGFVARYAGDEFVVVHDRLQSASAHLDLARQMVAALSAEFEAANQRLALSASLGVAVGSAALGFGADTLLAHADLAMYAAKQRADRICLYDRAIHFNVMQRAELARALRSPERSGLALGLIGVRNGTATNALRAKPVWEHPQLGPVHKRDIDVSCIRDFDVWVIDELIRNQVFSTPVIVPLSLSTVADSVFAADLAERFVRANVHPAQLIVELDEAEASHRADRLASQLEGVRELGVRIAVGEYSGDHLPLGQLARLKPSYLILAEALYTDRGLSYASSITRLAKDLGAEAVASGGLSPRHAKALRSAGLSLVEEARKTAECATPN